MSFFGGAFFGGGFFNVQTADEAPSKKKKKKKKELKYLSVEAYQSPPPPIPIAALTPRVMERIEDSDDELILTVLARILH